MKKILMSLLAVGMLAGCSKEFTKKQSGSFKVDGTEYNTPEDNVSASYLSGNSQFLVVSLYTGLSQTNTPQVTVDLNRVGETVNVNTQSSEFSYTTIGGAIYEAAYAQYTITSHEEGNPASRHTEGTFSMTVYDINNSDTIKITDGKFYVNNY